MQKTNTPVNSYFSSYSHRGVAPAGALTHHYPLEYRIAELLDAKGDSQTTMADAVGVSQSTVSKWCTGAQSPPANKLDRIARYSGVHPIELFSGEIISPAQRRLLLAIQDLPEKQTEKLVEALIPLADILKQPLREPQ